MGAKIETQFSKNVSHVFAISSDALFHHVDSDQLARFKGVTNLYLFLCFHHLIWWNFSEILEILCCDLWSFLYYWLVIKNLGLQNSFTELFSINLYVRKVLPTEEGPEARSFALVLHRIAIPGFGTVTKQIALIHFTSILM